MGLQGMENNSKSAAAHNPTEIKGFRPKNGRGAAARKPFEMGRPPLAEPPPSPITTSVSTRLPAGERET